MAPSSWAANTEMAIDGPLTRPSLKLISSLSFRHNTEELPISVASYRFISHCEESDLDLFNHRKSFQPSVLKNHA